MSFYGPIPELETVQEEEETRSDANALFKRSKKRSFTILEQKEVIEHRQFEEALFGSPGSLETSVADMLMSDSKAARGKFELRFCL